MNLILFSEAVESLTLPADDPRAKHLREVLRRRVGESFDAGASNGPRGKGTIAGMSGRGLALTFQWSEVPPLPYPLKLLLGLPRPQAARRLLQELTSLGVGEIHFFQAEKADPNYAQSTLWTLGEWQRHLIAGAEQAFTTHLPSVTHHPSLEAALATLPLPTQRFALDLYEATGPLSKFPMEKEETLLALGPERGWSSRERDHLRAHQIPLLHLGERVLRSDTAALAASACVIGKVGWW